MSFHSVFSLLTPFGDQDSYKRWGIHESSHCVSQSVEHFIIYRYKADLRGQGLKKYNSDIVSKGNEEVGFRSHTFHIAKLNQEEIQMILPQTKEWQLLAV